MTVGLPGADSSVPVTHQINGQTLIDLAIDLFGQAPRVWGRYFKSVTGGSPAEYRHAIENQPLRDQGIRVICLAQQTNHVGGDGAQGAADAQANAEDLIASFGAAYLQSQGGQVLMFLDVEGTGSSILSADYYLAWSQTLVSHSQTSSNGAVTIRPCIYAPQGNDPTWHALASAAHAGAPCDGAWIARWRHDGCAPLPNFDMSLVKPNVPIPCPILLWQYANDCNGSDGFDCDTINPNIDVQAFLGKCVLPPGT
jgi:hypothetical protein